MRKTRNKYRILNNQDIIESEEQEKQDPTQFPLYVRLNKLRKMREANSQKIIKPKSSDILKVPNDKFDKYSKKMIKENLEMSHPENYEGIYFKTHDEYVKFMKSKYTAKVDTIDLDSLYSDLEATFPRYLRDTGTKLIKSLRITPDEYKGFEKYKLIHKEKKYTDEDIDLYEFVIERRLKTIMKVIPQKITSDFEANERERSITWKQLTNLKQ